MSEHAKKAREAMKQKAARMTTADPHQRVDASSWSPPEMMNTEAKTGLRPVSRRAYKKGGKVVGKVHGEKAHKHAGRKMRKAGGRSMADEYVNRNVKDANAEFGKPHIGGYKKGGMAHKDEKQDRALVKKMVKADCRTEKKHGGAMKGNYTGGTRPTGGRIARKEGGRAKGKTNINIIIGGDRGSHAQPMMPPGQIGPVRPPVVAPPPPMPPQAQPVPLPGAGAGMAPPPMARKSGGRVGNRKSYSSFKDMDAGAGGGLGRLEKTEIQSKK